MNKKPSNPKHSLGIRKAPIHTLPMSVLSEVGLAFMEGGMKYGTHNYREDGVLASTYLDAVWRHLFQQWWDQGEDIDVESGLNHVTKAIASLCVLRDSMLFGNFTDDRPIRQVDMMGDLNHAASKLVDKYPNPVEGFTQVRKDMESRKIVPESLVTGLAPLPTPESDPDLSTQPRDDSGPEVAHMKVVQALRDIDEGELVSYGEDVKESEPISDHDLSVFGKALFDKMPGSDFIIIEKKGAARMTLEKMKQIELILGGPADQIEVNVFPEVTPGWGTVTHVGLADKDGNVLAFQKLIDEDEPKPTTAAEAEMMEDAAEQWLSHLEKAIAEHTFPPTSMLEHRTPTDEEKERPGIDKIPTRDGYRGMCHGCTMQPQCKEEDKDAHCHDCMHYTDNGYWPVCAKDRVLLVADPRVDECPFFERETDDEDNSLL
jgi:hypothetical protein